MTKRDELVVTVYRGLIQDAIARYPSDSSSLNRDLTRLERATEKLGHYFYAVEMPRVGNAFRQCFVSKNTSPLHGVNHCKFRPAYRRYPILFNSLWSKCFSEDGSILPLGPDPYAIKLLSQFFFCFKKLEGTCDEHLNQEAKDEFFSQEERIRNPTLQWSFGEFVHDGNLDLIDPGYRSVNPVSDDDVSPTFGDLIDPRLPRRFQQVADIFFGSLDWFNPEEWRCRHGPGSVAEKPRSGDKYVFGSWPDRLNSLFCFDAHATLNPDHIYDHDVVEHPAKLICVPKDARGPRLIASEPSYLQFAQQSINAFLRASVGKSMIRHSIRFADQSFSQTKAVEASVSGEYATVDLKSASDLLSLWLIERVMRKHKPLLSAIYHTRSRYIERDGVNFQFLKKVAPQGNAYIFPLQTIIYTLASIAALSIVDGKTKMGRRSIMSLSRQVRVFGDDIIIPTRAYGSLVQLLTFCGLKVNASKSFAEGNFREACGIDAYSGYDVTPAYVRAVPDVTSPESIVSSVECVNNLYSKGFYHASNALRGRIPQGFSSKIPEVHIRSGTFGFRKRNPDLNFWAVRYNADLQRQEVRCLVPISKVLVRPIEGIRNLVQFITENPSPLEKWNSGHRTPLDLKLRSRWVPLVELLG